MAHTPQHKGIGTFSNTLPFQSSRFTNTAPTQEYRAATNQLTPPSNLDNMLNATQTRIQKTSASTSPTQTDISSLIGTTGNEEIFGLSENLSATLDSGSKKDEGFFGKLTNIANQFSENIAKPGFMEALVMHQTALKGGDFTEVLLAGVKARNATTDRLFKSAYNNAQYENLKARTDALNNPKAAATKQVTGDDGLKYTLGADGSYTRTFPGQEKKVTDKTDEGLFPKDYSLSNVSKSINDYIKANHFPNILTEGNSKYVNREIQSKLNAASTQLAEQVAPLIETMGLNAAMKSVIDPYAQAGAFKNLPATGQGYFFDGPAVDAKSIIDLDVIQSGIVLPTDPKMQEAFIAKQMEANPTLSREQVIEEIQKAIRSGRLK